MNEIYPSYDLISTTTELISVSSISFTKFARNDGVDATHAVIYIPLTIGGVGTCVATRTGIAGIKGVVVACAVLGRLSYFSSPNEDAPIYRNSVANTKSRKRLVPILYAFTLSALWVLDLPVLADISESDNGEADDCVKSVIVILRETQKLDHNGEKSESDDDIPVSHKIIIYSFF
jgi:hypothetical protein